MTFETAGVVGAGTMGNGIAQVLAASGRKVRLVDVSKAALDRGMGAIQKSLAKLVEKGKVSAAVKDSSLERLQPATDLEALRGCSIAVEAVIESLPTKMAVFAKLQEVLGDDAVLASNTSSISITEIARTVRRPERVIGMHFMNPVPLMELVEIVRGVTTSEETVQSVRDLSIALGKTPVVVQDYPGFVSNRVLMPMINEAVYCLMEGVADKDAIDTVMKLGMAHPMGPLKLADLIGLDVCLSIMEVLHQGFGDPKYRPCPLLRNMVAAGKLGRKTGEGFYSYTS
ncbi:MAG TPA: 3-hydroxybutyryl-CoA dehydrogenase [bacterium]|nr:3-hydroxybutyryl-CoA dehydrogenase [bacterium]